LFVCVGVRIVSLVVPAGLGPVMLGGRRYNLRIDDQGYDVNSWVGFLEELKNRMEGITIPSEDLIVDAEQDFEKLNSTINNISLDPSNWII
jgi:hypothetical protein